MRKYIFLTLVFICLVSIAAYPVLAQKGREGMGEDRGKASDMMEQGKNMRERQGMHGMGFMHSAGNAYGEYVTFTIDNQTGNVLNYGINGTTLFNISIVNFNYKSTSSQGSVTFVSNTDGSTSIQLHDNPAAVINIQTTRGISVTFSLAEGVNATKEEDLVRIEAGGVVGYITGYVSSGGAVTSSISDRQVKMAASPNGAVIFRAAPVNMPMFDHMYRALSREIARNRVGMEIAMGRNGTYSSINYSPGMQMRIQAMERDSIRLLVNASEPSGRIIAFNLDNTSLAVGAHQRLRINYDGQPMQCVDDPNIVFNGTDRPLCWISPVQDSVRAQLMIYVPHFSEHAIDIVVETEVTPTAAAPEGKIITLADDGKTITLQINETFLLQLGEEYDWNVTVDDQTVLSRRVNVLVIRGAQGIYEGHKPGRATLTATGDPVCRKETPPCAAPSRQFRLGVVVAGSPAASPKTPGFEVIFAISALLAALLVRRR